MTGAPLVTVGITCFNAEGSIGRAIASAQAQDWPALEIVVADDASSDGSVALVREMAAADPRLRLVVRGANGGAAVARNTILAEARGEFVAFFDDDDESLGGRLRAQIEAIAAYEQATGAQLIACYAAGERRYPNGYVKPLPAIGTRGQVPHGPGLADYLLFYRRIPGWDYGGGTSTAALCARAETFAAVGGFDPALRRVEDVDFAIRLALAGGHFIGTRAPLFVQYPSAGADKRPEANRDAEVALAEKHAAYLKKVSRYYYATHWPRLRYQHFRRNYLLFLLEFAKIFLHNPLAATRHLLTTGPVRLRHERRMQEGRIT